MGYNTTVLILNDALDTLRDNAEEFVDGIIKKMHDGGDISVGNHANPAHVMQTAHADVFRLYCTIGNSIVELSPYSTKTRELLGDEPNPHRRKFLERCIRDAEERLAMLKETMGEDG